MRISATAIVLAGAAAATLIGMRDARACGGCYHRPSETETTVVTGHRMAVAVSPTQTVLWDQIQYAGEPSEFAWVLPIKPGARLELATDAWFETLDSATAAHVVAPPLDCASPPTGGTSFGCGSANEAALGAEDRSTPGGDVTIVHEGTVGPYETVTLSTDQPGALNTWLSDHGYAVGTDVQPIIDAYVAEGFDFIALRLQPGAGIRQMKPVRVVSPGASPTFPLRMVAAGTGPSVDLTVFVIGEGRWATANFPNGTVPVDRLSWDYVASASNYASLRQDALAANDGRTWLTTFAKPGGLLQPMDTSFSSGTNAEIGPATTTIIGAAYLQQAVQDGETMVAACDTSFLADALSTSVVVDPCPPDATDPTQCASIQPGQLDARAFACGAADDLAVALTGMHPHDVWLARLEAALPRAALASDLELTASSDQSAVTNVLEPKQALNAQDVCRANGSPAAMIAPQPRGGQRTGRSGLVLISLASIGVIAALRRRRSRRNGA